MALQNVESLIIGQLNPLASMEPLLWQLPPDQIQYFVLLQSADSPNTAHPGLFPEPKTGVVEGSLHPVPFQEQ